MTERIDDTNVFSPAMEMPADASRTERQRASKQRGRLIGGVGIIVTSLLVLCAVTTAGYLEAAAERDLAQAAARAMRPADATTPQTAGPATVAELTVAVTPS